MSVRATRRRPQRDRNGSTSDGGAAHVVGLGIALVLTLSAVGYFITKANPAPGEQELDLENERTALHVVTALTRRPGEPSNWVVLNDSNVTSIGLLESSDSAFLDGEKFNRIAGNTSMPANWAWLKARLGAENQFLRLRFGPSVSSERNGTVGEIVGDRVAFVTRMNGAQEHASIAVERAALGLAGVAFDDAYPTYQVNRGAGDRFRDWRNDTRGELALRLAGLEGGNTSYVASAAPEWSYWQPVMKGASFPASGAWWSASTPTQLLTPATWDAAADSFRVPYGRTYAATLGYFDFTDYPNGSAELTVKHFADVANDVLRKDNASIKAKCFGTCPFGLSEIVLWSTEADVGSKSAFTTTVRNLDAYAGDALLVWLEFTASTLPPVFPGDGWFMDYVAVNATTFAGKKATLYENRFDFNTTRYDTLVVASEADHDAFGAADQVAKSAVHEWIEQGGKLLALGSTRGDKDWLATNFTNTGAASSASGLLEGKSDYSHPSLRVPHEVPATALPYVTTPYAPNDNFMDVLVADDGATGTVPVLSVTGRTLNFTGAVMLTSVTPGQIGSATLRFHFFVNALSYLDGGRYHSEFGETVPDGVTFATAEAGAVVRAGDESRPVRMVAFVWD